MAAVYVALGDSMSIDDYAGGVGRGAASLLFRNRDTDFPGWAGRDLATAGYTAQMLARDGAVSTDVLERQLPLIDRRPALVTITMGGNDLLTAYGDSMAAQSGNHTRANRGRSGTRRMAGGPTYACDRLSQRSYRSPRRGLPATGDHGACTVRPNHSVRGERPPSL